jgi:cell division protein FtsI/penicillin-binding protein 2
VSSAPPIEEPTRDFRLDPPLTRERFDFARARAGEIDPSAVPRLVEWVDLQGRTQTVPGLDNPNGAFRVEYSMDEELTGDVFDILRRGRVDRGHAIVLDPRNGRLLAYASTDRENFPAERAYPAASIVKILTAAAMLEEGEGHDSAACIYRGNKYRLNRRRLDRPSSGRESSLEDALASSNNQCFSQWALHVLGEEKLTQTFERFGWLSSPAPGHEAGRVEQVESRLDLGRLGSGLDGVRVTPLHIAALTSILTGGSWIEPWWVDRIIDSQGQSVPLPPRRAKRRVLSNKQAAELRSMMTATTTRGTAKSAFRTKRGRPMLGDIRVAGKTGNISGRDPDGRYEWFVGLAPAQDPKIAVVVLQLQGHLWWAKSSEIGARVLRNVFCDRSGCREARADRWTGDLGKGAAPQLISELERPLRISRAE